MNGEPVRHSVAGPMKADPKRYLSPLGAIDSIRFVRGIHESAVEMGEYEIAATARDLVEKTQELIERWIGDEMLKDSQNKEAE